MPDILAFYWYFCHYAPVMNTIFKRSVLDSLEAYLNNNHHHHHESMHKYISPGNKNIWNLKQFIRTEQILARIFDIISKSYFSNDEKEQLKEILEHLFIAALPYFIQGMDKNPVHHNVQTVENILLITIREHEHYKFIIKNAVILALFHDIGNGFVDPSLKKIKSSDIINHIQKLKAEQQPEIKIKREIKRIIRQAKDFRNAHMKEGAKIAKILLKQYISENKKKAIISLKDINKIVQCILIHDLPSTTWYNARLGMDYKAHDLLPFTNKLVVVLREADRLWMVSDDGLKKDLFDDIKKETESVPDPLEKLKHNIKRFKDEYNLYIPVYKNNPETLRRFKGNTLFQTESGFQLFIHSIFTSLKGILENDYKITIAVSLGGTNLSIALVFPGGIIVEIVPPIDWRTSFNINDQEMYAEELRYRIAEKLKTVINIVDNTIGRNYSGIIGISCKGPLHIIDGIKILGAGKKLTTLPFKDYPLEVKIKESLENYYLTRTFNVTLVHDGSAAVMGETAPGGTLAGEKNAAAIIIGSGIGIGIIKNNTIVSKDSGSLGRYLVRLEEENNTYRYEYITKKTKKGLKPVRDLKELPDKYKKYTGKAIHLTQRIAGPWLAERLAKMLITAGKTQFLKDIKKVSNNTVTREAIHTYLRDKAAHKNLEKEILANCTEAAKKGSDDARDFIVDVGKELGLALSEFIYTYRKNPFIKHIVLVSSVAENFGNGVTGKNGRDLFIHTIRENVRENLLKKKSMNQGNCKEIADGIIRSKISVEREYLAFTPE